MRKASLQIGIAVALVAAPVVAGTTPQHVPREGAGLFSVAVWSDCTLKLSPGGNFPLSPISALGGNAPESTAENDAIVSCGGDQPQHGGDQCDGWEDGDCPLLAITDQSSTGTTSYTLVSAKNKVSFKICAGASGSGCYKNSTIGFRVGKKSTTKLFGYLPTQGKTAPGKYADTVTVTLTFF